MESFRKHVLNEDSTENLHVLSEKTKHEDYDRELKRLGINMLTWVNPLKGGFADDEEITNFDLDQLIKGIKVETEHTNDKDIALKIAMDHLHEIPDYYTRLEKMEREAGIIH